MNNDLRFELLVIDFLANSMEGLLYYDKDSNTFDDDFNLVYLDKDFNYSYEELKRRINRLEQFGVINQTYTDTKKLKWIIKLDLDFNLIDLLGIESVKMTVFQIAQKLGVYALSDMETLILHTFNYIVATNVEETYDDLLKDKNDKSVINQAFVKYQSISKDVEFNDEGL